jgi:hypothetical protein
VHANCLQLAVPLVDRVKTLIFGTSIKSLVTGPAYSELDIGVREESGALPWSRSGTRRAGPAGLMHFSLFVLPGRLPSSKYVGKFVWYQVLL